MPEIEVLFEVPPAIAKGLATGALERVGGVIRETGSKQVVAWLREGGKIASNPNILTGGLGSVATGILNTAISAHSHRLIMQALERQAMLIGTMGLLNIAISGCTLYILSKRITRLEKQIEEIHNRIIEEFTRDRQINLLSALESMRDVVEAEGDSYKRAAQRLSQDLDSARRHILHDFNRLLKDSMGAEQGQMAQDYLLLAMQVDAMRIRCYLETDEHKLARKRLNERLEDYRKQISEFIHKLLGERRAMYFHKTISDEDFKGWLRIEGWLRRKDDVLLELVKGYRHDFWDNDAIQAFTPSRSLPFSLPFRQAEEPTRHLLALIQAELLIENYKRLQGFESELAAIERLGLSEWDARTNIEDHDDYVILVDANLLQQAERLSHNY